jgi:hypothetical protein
MQSPLRVQQQNDSNNGDEVNHLDDELQASTSSQPISTEQTEITEPLVEENQSETNGNEQQIVDN